MICVMFRNNTLFYYFDIFLYDTQSCTLNIQHVVSITTTHVHFGGLHNCFQG